MPRIIAGSRGSRRIEAPAGERTRPTPDRVREAVFASVGTYLTLEGARILDLYCGSGAMAFEGLSRGAGRATLVDRSRAALSVSQRNQRTLGLAGESTVVSADVTDWLTTAPSSRYDLVYLDPPYARPVEPDLRALVDRGWLTDGAVVGVERATRTSEVEWPTGLDPLRKRVYGDTTVHYARFAPPEEPEPAESAE